MRQCTYSQHGIPARCFWVACETEAHLRHPWHDPPDWTVSNSRTVVHRDGSGQPVHEGHRRVVEGHGRIRDIPGYRSQVDDDPAVSGHLRQHGPTVDAHHQIPIVVSGIQRGLLQLHPRDVDQEGQRSVGLVHLGDDASGVSAVGHVGLDPHDGLGEVAGPDTPPARHRAGTVAVQPLHHGTA
jgi:hypothetical protein